LRLNKQSIFGAFETLYHKRALFVYKTFTNVSGYIIRKKAWKEIADANSEIFDMFKRKALFDYYFRIRNPLLAHRKLEVEHFDLRYDYRQVLTLQDYNGNEMKEILIDEISRGHQHSELDRLNLNLQSYEKFIYNTLKHVEKAEQYSKLAAIEQEKLKTEEELVRF